MAEYIGRRVNLGIAKESTRGVGVAPTFWLPRTELTFNDRVTKVVSGESHGHIDDSTDQFITEKFADGSVAGEVRLESFGLFLLAALGSVSSSTVSGAENHTFTEANDNQHQSLTFTIDSPLNDDALFELTMLNSLTIDVTPGEIITYTADWMAKGSADTTQTATYTAEDRFIGKHATFKLAAATSGLDAATAVPLKAFSITFSKNTVRDHETGTVQPTDILNQQFSVDGSFTLNREDNTFRDLMTDNTYQAMRLDLVNDDILIGYLNPRLKIDLSRCNFMDWDPDQTLDAITTETLSFKGHRDVANSKDIVDEILLVNNTASY